MSDHLDLDALADAVDGEPDPHLATCTDCSRRLTELRSAQLQVSAALAGLPAPPLPVGLSERLTDSLRPATASVTTLPGPRHQQRRWLLPVAAAAVLVLGGIGYGVTALRPTGTSSTASAAKAAAPAAGRPFVSNDSGADYSGRDSLAAAVPRLLTGAPAAAGAESNQDSRLSAAAPPAAAAPLRSGADVAPADPLARLRTDPGRAECLAALLPPDDPSVQPLALDYARFRGVPALVVVLPGSVAHKLDVFVVGAGCARSADGTLFYASVDAP